MKLIQSLTCSLHELYVESDPIFSEKIKRYGAPALLLSWAPIIGDALCAAAGFLRLNPWLSILHIAIEKAARYAVIAWMLN